MFKRLVARSFAGLMVIALFALTACDSLPKNDEQRAARIKTDVSQLATRLERVRSDFNSIQTDAGQWEFFAPYAEKENWAATFVQVEQDLKGLQARYKTKVTPLLEADKSEDSVRLNTELDGIFANFEPLKDKMGSVKSRMDLLRSGYENASQWREDAQTFVANILAITKAVQPTIEQTKSDFPSRVDAIDERFAPLSLLLTQAETAFVVVKSEFARHDAGDDADYAAFADAYEVTKANNAAAVTEDTDYREQLQSLYEEYTTVLRDMKREWWVKPQQETWCDYVDCWSNTNEFPYVSVSMSTFNRVTAREELSDADVREIGLNPNHDQGAHRGGKSWYLQDWEVRYFHKYAEVNGSAVSEGDWEEVDEVGAGGDFGWAENVDNFGMALATKKLGQFDDETVLDATPPGMDMVGDERYGRWESDGNGGQRWSWLETYAFYHLMFGGNSRYYYSQNDYRGYSSWRNDRRGSTGTAAYYGGSNNSPRYGSSGAVTSQSASYKSSPFARTGGAKSVSANVRKAGASARARGPSGGGK
jgi:hypothetical protein